MNTVGQSADTRTVRRPYIKAASLIRWAGLAAVAAGVIFAGIQPVHPPDVLASVTTNAWITIITLKFVMCLFFLLGITGIYARQVEESGWLGLAGYLLFTLSWFLQTGYVFTDLFILPVTASAAPGFVDSFLGIVNGNPGEMNIGALAPVYNLLSLLFLLGGLLLGIATFRARVLPRWAGGLLAIACLATPLGVLLPHAIQRLMAVPIGIAFAWLGVALFLDRRDAAAEERYPCPDTTQLVPSGAD